MEGEEERIGLAYLVASEGLFQEADDATAVGGSEREDRCHEEDEKEGFHFGLRKSVFLLFEESVDVEGACACLNFGCVVKLGAKLPLNTFARPQPNELPSELLTSLSVKAGGRSVGSVSYVKGCPICLPGDTAVDV